MPTSAADKRLQRQTQGSTADTGTAPEPHIAVLHREGHDDDLGAKDTGARDAHWRTFALCTVRTNVAVHTERKWIVLRPRTATQRATGHSPTQNYLTPALRIHPTSLPRRAGGRVMVGKGRKPYNRYTFAMIDPVVLTLNMGRTQTPPHHTGPPQSCFT